MERRRGREWEGVELSIAVGEEYISVQEGRSVYISVGGGVGSGVLS